MADAATFYDVWADVYDDELGDRELSDRAFYRDLAREADGPVLEVGCGTGRIYLDLLRDGVDADGIDVSRDSLDELAEKADAAGLDPSVEVADMTSFEPDRAYELVIVPFRAFNHNVTLSAQRNALETLRDALVQGGRLVCNSYVPDYDVICEQYGEPETHEFERDGKTYTATRVSTIEDPVEGTVRIEGLIERDGEVVRESSLCIALISKREYDLLFRTTGWSDWSVYGGFEFEPLESADQEMVWVAEK
jgi:SAM-dependent methyltransferase